MIKKLTLLLSVMFVFSSVSIAQNYIGAAKCKMCHNKSTTGQQYKKWTEARHSKAFETLKSEKAVENGKKYGIEKPWESEKCLKCHSTYHAANADIRGTVTEAEGVSCESCHGPGSKYKSMAIMKDREKSIAAGMIVPTKETCVVCHTPEGNDFYKEFNFDEAVKKIAHPNPAK